MTTIPLVMITGGFLADAAATVDNLLHVWGGVVTRYTVGPDRQFQLVLVVLTQQDSGTAEPAVHVEIVPPASEAGLKPVPFTLQAPKVALDNEIGFCYWGIRGDFPVDGRYVFVLSSGDESAISIPLHVDSAQP